MRQTSRAQLGFTLLELSAVVALTSVLMLVAVALLRSVLDWSHANTTAGAHAANLQRMERELRGQLREATDVSLVGNALDIAYNSETAHWKLGDSACELRIDGSEGPRFERYEIGPRTAWELTIDGPLTTVTLEPPRGERGLPFRVVVGRNRSLEAPAP